MIENIVPQSAGSLSVAVLALIMVIVQVTFFFRKTRFVWYGWGAGISLSGLLYAIGVFLEYNTLPGSLNRFAGLLEFTAVICLVHCFYGFTFSSLEIESRRYHIFAGIFHGLVLVLLWSGNAIVADRFVTRNFFGSGTARTPVHALCRVGRHRRNSHMGQAQRRRFQIQDALSCRHGMLDCAGDS